jgi:hypothetical protein
MRILYLNSSFLYTLILFFFISNSFSQEHKTSISQDPRFEELLNERKKINANTILNDRYKIQIFTGDNESSKKALSDFKKNNKNVDASIVFQTPIYKVLIGNFKSRIEAEKKLQELNKKYTNAFLIKPAK